MRIIRWIYFIIYYAWNLTISSFRIAIDIIRPGEHMTPGIVEVPVSLKKKHHLLAFFNLVTMTPGSMSIDFSEAKDKLYIHSLYLDDVNHFRADMRLLEEKIKRII